MIPRTVSHQSGHRSDIDFDNDPSLQ